MKEWHGTPPRSRWASPVALALLALLMAHVAHATPPPLYPGVSGPAHDPMTGGPHEQYGTLGTATEGHMPPPSTQPVDRRGPFPVSTLAAPKPMPWSLYRWLLYWRWRVFSPWR